MFESDDGGDDRAADGRGVAGRQHLYDDLPEERRGDGPTFQAQTSPDMSTWTRTGITDVVVSSDGVTEIHATSVQKHCENFQLFVEAS